jgi:hypothetical protein
MHGVGMGHEDEHRNYAFSVRTQFTEPTGKRSGHPRGMSLATRMLAFKTSRRGNQWHPRVHIPVEKTRAVPIPLSTAAFSVVAEFTERILYKSEHVRSMPLAAHMQEEQTPEKHAIGRTHARTSSEAKA